MTRDLSFEQFVKTNLGDVAVWDESQHQYISPKIRLYFVVWVKSQSSQKTSTQEILAGIDVNNYYETDAGTFSINRENNLRVICEWFGHTTQKQNND